MAGQPSNFVDEILAAMQAASSNQGAYNRYAPDASNQTLNDGTKLQPEGIVPLDVAAMVRGMQQGRKP